MKIVSVIIPAYNASDLDEAIASLFSQSLTPDEVIVVDGSPNTTLSFLNGCRDRIQYHYQSPQGVSSARNYGVERANGKYIALLDADDVWLAGKLEKQIALLEAHPEAGFSFSTVWNLVDTDEEAIPSQPFFPPALREWMTNNEHENGSVRGRVYDLLLQVNCIATSSLVIRRDAFNTVGLFDESLKNAEDYELELRLAKHYPAIFIVEPTSRYRVHDTGLSGAWAARAELFHRTNLAALEKHCRLFPSLAVKKAIAQTLASYALDCLKSGESRAAADYSRRSLRLYPSLRALKYLTEAVAPRAYGRVRDIARRHQSYNKF